jgi:RNA polymerase sigma-70 factor (ECF subfamily)
LALESARGNLVALHSVAPDSEPPPNSLAEQLMTSAFTDAFESGDISRIVALLADDVTLDLRPSLVEYRGASEVSWFLSVDLRNGVRRYLLTAARRDVRPTFGCYVLEPHAAVCPANGAIALTLRGNRISSLTRFTNNRDVARFGLPLTILAQ